MKTFFVIVILGALVYGAIRLFPSFFSGMYESIEYGVKFRYPSSRLVTERPDKDMLEIQAPGKGEGYPFVFFRKYKYDNGSELSLRIPQEFGLVMLDEKAATFNGVEGISFSWNSKSGLESAFGFESGDRDYMLSTYGMPDKVIKGDFNMILGSLSVMYE